MSRMPNQFTIKSPGLGTANSLVQDSTTNLPITIKCSRSWPCKRPSCHDCNSIRRKYFVRLIGLEFQRGSMSSFLTVSWKISDSIADFWRFLGDRSRNLFKNFSRHGESYLSVRSLGERKGRPHIHVLTTEKGERNLTLRAKRRWSNGEVSVNSQLIKSELDAIKVAGYIFDKNLTPSLRDSSRPKGYRIVMGSIGKTWGYPKDIDWQRIDSFSNSLSKSCSLEGEVL